MELTEVLAGGAAAAVLFWPQLRGALASFLPALGPAAPPVASGTVAVSRPVGSSRADWIADLIALQAVLDSNGQAEAAQLVAQAAVKVIGSPVTSPAKK